MRMFKEVETMLASMNRAEKAELLQWVARDLGDAYPGIDSDPLISGGEACCLSVCVFRSGCWFSTSLGNKRSRIYCEVILRYGQKIWQMHGLTIAHTARKLSNRLRIMRPHKVWLNCMLMKISLNLL